MVLIPVFLIPMFACGVDSYSPRRLSLNNFFCKKAMLSLRTAFCL